MRRLSVVMPNDNYEKFVGSAIHSALAVDWPDVEVIVVDDGSTDDSGSIIRSFGARITAMVVSDYRRAPTAAQIATG